MHIDPEHATLMTPGGYTADWMAKVIPDQKLTEVLEPSAELGQPGCTIRCLMLDANRNIVVCHDGHTVEVDTCRIIKQFGMLPYGICMVGTLRQDVFGFPRGTICFSVYSDPRYRGLTNGYEVVAREPDFPQHTTFFANVVCQGRSLLLYRF